MPGTKGNVALTVCSISVSSRGARKSPPCASYTRHARVCVRARARFYAGITLGGLLPLRSIPRAISRAFAEPMLLPSY